MLVRTIQNGGAVTAAPSTGPAGGVTSLAVPEAAEVVRDRYGDRVYLVSGPVPAVGMRMPERAQFGEVSAVPPVPLLLAEGAAPYRNGSSPYHVSITHLMLDACSPRETWTRCQAPVGRDSIRPPVLPCAPLGLPSGLLSLIRGRVNGHHLVLVISAGATPTLHWLGIEPVQRPPARPAGPRGHRLPAIPRPTPRRARSSQIMTARRVVPPQTS